MQTNILCEREEQTALTNLFEDLSSLLQDCDEEEEKERIKKALQSMKNNTTYMFLGEEGSGKTSLLRALFQDIFDTSENMAGDVCEYRWGEQDFTTPVTDGVQKRFVTNENMKGLSIIDTRGVNRIAENSLEKLRKLAENCSAIFVVLSADHVGSPRLWDFIENFPTKNMVFFITKCDLVSLDELEKNINKAKRYMEDAGISATVFPVSIKETAAGSISMEEVRLYIREQLIGPNPILRKQRENVEETKNLLAELNKSFALRKQQYTSDAEILQKINHSMDAYVADHKKTIADLTEMLAIEINKDIDSYQQEIISKMDPYKIKERFRTKEDFAYYLNMTNENYKAMMTDSVNQKTIEALKGCLHDLEIVFQEAVGYFNTRENILELDDRFYGSMSKSKTQIVAETKETVISAGELYGRLSNASEELFLKIWGARDEYDKKIRQRRALSVAGGGGAGAAITAAVVASSFTAICIGVIVGAVVINIIAKNLYDPKAAGKMEETAQKCIEQFKAEVDHTRAQMIEQVTEQVTSIFEKELASMDGCFTEFRMSVNIDEKKLPLLEQKLKETEKLIEVINNL